MVPAHRLPGTEPAVHFLQHCDQANGIDVEHGLSETVIAGDWIVSGHGQNIVETLAA